MSTLVDVSSEPPGESCAFGGTRIDRGLDADGDGVLSTEEIDMTEYVCNGDAAVAMLVAVADEPAGAECASGGQRIDTGLDNGDGGETANDGVLGSGEIDATQYVCDGFDGNPALVTMTDEPRGANCHWGGRRVDAGLDDGSGGGTAGNGVLEAGEITSTSYLCMEPTTLTPGNTTTFAQQGRWSVRCLAWTGDVCDHMQARMDCSVCSAYTQCDLWHDLTDYNNGGNRTALNWCAIATGIPTVDAIGTGAAASSPVGCGYSTTHPVCTAARATYRVDHPDIGANLGLNLDDDYCGGSMTLLTVDCAGW